MSLSRETMLELMALADGELEGEDKERVERLAAESDEARRVIDAMRGTAVRVWLADSMGGRSRIADGIADAVLKRLDAPAMAGVSDPLPVARLLPRPGSAARSRQASRAMVAAAIVGPAVAIAATVALYVRSRDPVGDPAPVASVLAPSSEMRPAALTTTGIALDDRAGLASGVEVEEIDSAEHVSIFEIPALASASTRSSVVVWIDDDPSEK